MITLRQGTRLIDLLMIGERLRQNEREQIEACYGFAFDFESMASFGYGLPDPKWTGFDDSGQPVLAAGMIQQRPGVWLMWGMTTDAAWKQPIAVTKAVLAILRTMVNAGAHRIEHISMVGYPKNQAWYEKCLKFNFEGTMRAWGCQGQDALMFARTEKN